MTRDPLLLLLAALALILVLSLLAMVTAELALIAHLLQACHA